MKKGRKKSGQPAVKPGRYRRRKKECRASWSDMGLMKDGVGKAQEWIVMAAYPTARACLAHPKPQDRQKQAAIIHSARPSLQVEPKPRKSRRPSAFSGRKEAGHQKLIADGP
jgi:hypothetical protein